MNHEALDKALQQCALFEGIPEQDRTALLGIAAKRHLPKNIALFSEGDRADGFYLILSGRVKVYKISPDGKEHILHIFGPGEPVGEVPVFSGKEFPAFAETLKQSDLLYFPRSRFLALASRQPQVLLNMLATLSMRLRKFTQKIEQLSLKEVASRLSEALLEMAGEAAGTKGKEEVIELRFTKGQLASQLGTTPETLSRTFQRMTRLGLIRVDRKRVALLDRKGLEGLALGSHPLETHQT
jgi:CRP/FNR family transcriptional regulator, dissimilatory nitrate respiration regulator